MKVFGILYVCNRSTDVSAVCSSFNGAIKYIENSYKTSLSKSEIARLRDGGPYDSLSIIECNIPYPDKILYAVKYSCNRSHDISGIFNTLEEAEDYINCNGSGYGDDDDSLSIVECRYIASEDSSEDSSEDN
jgi:hypothetical protein